MQRRRLALYALILAIIGGVGYWRLTKNKETSRSEFMMGTYVEIKAYGRKAPQALEAVFSRLAAIEARMTLASEESEIVQINKHAGMRPVAVSDDTFFVIAKALEYAKLTQGRFDPTIQPIVSLWQIGSPQARVPAAQEIAAKLPAVGYQAVTLDSQKKTVWLTQPHMGLDLGGIAKGYAADEAVRILRQYGINQAMINLGGNLYVLGNSPTGQPWRIGIQDPLNEQNTYVAIVSAQNETLVTSGAYERFLEVDGKRYHHIIDPLTGYPAQTDVLSVTIIAKTSIDADALSTSVFILGRDAGLNLIQQLEDIEAVIIDENRQVFATDGVQERLSVSDPQYVLTP